MGWLIRQEWWRVLAVSAAIASLVVLALFPNAFHFTFPNKLGVTTVDVVTLVALL